MVQLHLLHDDVVQLEVEFELEVELMQIYYFILQLHFVVESSPPSSLISVSGATQLRCFQGSPSLHPLYNVIYDFAVSDSIQNTALFSTFLRPSVRPYVKDVTCQLFLII